MLINQNDQKLHECMLRTMTNMSQSFLYVDKHETKPFYANAQAIRNFADQNGEIDLRRIFGREESSSYLRDTVVEQLKIADYVMLHEIPVTDNRGEVQLCEVQTGYSDDEKNIIFLEIFYHN
ncbi:MAG: hypothetical protein R3Y63_07425 [Eubacteriales bacterium]